MKNFIKDFIIFIVLFIFAGDLSICHGMDRTWDVLNYHIYNPYAFLNNRLLIDIMPAGIQSYFNPLIDVPYYLCINYLNNYPVAVTFLMGFSYALLLFMVYKISDFIFQQNKKRYFYSIISVIIASGLTESVKLVGWLSNDLFIGDLALISIYLLLKSLDKKDSNLKILFAGLIIGCALGLKLTAIIFAVPLLITFILFYKRFYNPFKSFLLLLSGVLFGFLLFDGFWMYKMYKYSGNPFFPYFDWLFHSDMINVQNIYSVDFGKWKPSGFLNAVFHVFTANITQYTLVSKFLWCLFFINLFLEPFIKREQFEKFFKVLTLHLNFLWIFILFSYIIWLNTFTVIRYFTSILCLVGIIAFFTSLKIFYLILFFIAKIKNKEITVTITENNLYSLLIAICLILAFFPNYKLEKPKKLVRIPINENILAVEDLYIPNNSIVIVEHGAAIFIPSQNKNVRYIGLNSYHFRKVWKTLLSDKKTDEIRTLIKQNPQNIYLLARTTLKEFKNVDIEKVSKEVEKHKNTEIIFRDESRQQNELRVWEAMAYDLDLLGINVKATKCHKIKHNIFDYKYAHLYKYPIFSYCKLELNKN